MTNYPIKVGEYDWLNPAHVAQVFICKQDEDKGGGYRVIWYATSAPKWHEAHSVFCDSEFDARAVVADYRAAVAEAESRGV